MRSTLNFVNPLISAKKGKVTGLDQALRHQIDIGMRAKAVFIKRRTNTKDLRDAMIFRQKTGNFLSISSGLLTAFLVGASIAQYSLPPAFHV